MADAEVEIQEVPLEDLAQPAISEDNTTEIAEQVTENAPAEPAPVKRGRGRPKGSTNKPKAAPPATKAKAAPKKARPKTKPEPVYEEESESSGDPETPPPRARRHAAAAPNLDRAQLAAEVLGLLSRQRVDRVAARRNTYARWVQNM